MALRGYCNHLETHAMKIPHQMLWSVVGGFALATGAYAGGGSGQAEVQMMDTDRRRQHLATEHAAGAKQMFAKMDGTATAS
jgi:hypothetical protein